MIKKVSLKRILNFLKGSPKTTIGLTMLIITLAMTMGAPLFTDIDPLYRFDGQYQVPPSSEHILGTTQLGRDVFSQVLYGGQKSIAVGFFAGSIAVALSLVLGISAGYFGGLYDSIISSIINVVMVIPNIVLLLIIASLLGGISPFLICVIIGLTSWPWNARVLRAQTMSIRSREFVYSAETLGESKWRIIMVEIMPNMLSMISSAFVSTIIYAIMAHATLEFIGFGDPLSVTWGIMLFNAQSSGAMLSGAWWEVFGPISGLLLMGISLTLINFSIDEVSNPKLRVQRFMRIYYKKQKQQKKQIATQKTQQSEVL